jgi:hypothetical protein
VSVWFSEHVWLWLTDASVVSGNVGRSSSTSGRSRLIACSTMSGYSSESSWPKVVFQKDTVRLIISRCVLFKPAAKSSSKAFRRVLFEGRFLS